MFELRQQVEMYKNQIRAKERELDKYREADNKECVDISKAIVKQQQSMKKLQESFSREKRELKKIKENLRQQNANLSERNKQLVKKLVTEKKARAKA